MKLDENEIRKAVENGEITAYSLDTNIFHKESYRFEQGLLARLKQFKEEPLSLVLSDVVTREILSHVRDDAKSTQDKTLTAIKNASPYWQFDKENRDKVGPLLFGTEQPFELAERRLNQFVDDCGVKVIRTVDNADLDAVLENYFNLLPPFEDASNKKHEFPDALALSALEGWAEREKTKVLVASNDKGWKSYCDASDYLVCVNNLATAVDYLQKHKSVEIRDRLAKQYLDGTLDLTDKINEAIASSIDEDDFEIDADSYLYYESEIYDFEINSFTLRGDKAEPFTLVERVSSTEIAVAMRVLADITVHASFSFSVRDGIDRDMVAIGSGSKSAPAAENFTVILTFEMKDGFELLDIEAELEPPQIEVLFGTVGPDETDWD